MALQIPESLKVQAFAETTRIESPDEFSLIRKSAEAEISRIVKEEMEPNQSIDTTLTELRDVYLSALLFESKLAAVHYDKSKRDRLRDAIRLLESSEHWLNEDNHARVYRVRPVAEVVAASRPWRSRISKIGAHAFVFDEDLAEQFADVNSSNTLEEEKNDLEALNFLIDTHKVTLQEYGLTDALIQEGIRLQGEAKGRDFFAILGLRDKDDALRLRNRCLTYAVLRGKEARAAGTNACFDDEDALRRFESSSFRNALRRLRPRRKSPGSEAPLPEEKVEL